jgi:peptide/nickel transport system permease protein
MTAYILKRLLFALPVLGVLALLSFILMVNTPGDPVLRALAQEGIRQGDNPQLNADTYKRKRKELGLDKPLFWCSLQSAADADSLFMLTSADDRNFLRNLSIWSGKPQASKACFDALQQLESKIQNLKSAEQRLTLQTFLLHWKQKPPAELSPALQAIAGDTTLRLIWQSLQVPEMHPNASLIRNLPVVHWHGTDNIFHQWILRLLQGDWGLSYQDGRPVTDAVAAALQWTLLLNLLSLILAYAVSIPAGIYAARNHNTPGERLLTGVWFVLFALPGFWSATLLILFLGSGEYLSLFPSGGLSDIEAGPHWPWYQRWADLAHHLVLPTFTYTYAAIAYISGHVKNGVIDQMRSDYVRTARAKGMKENQVIWKHAFRNALMPFITLIGQVFPALVSGSLILETVFSIPGMGLLTWQAIGARDYPIVISVFMMSGVLSLTGMLIADILYTLADPRIRLHKS